MSVRAQVPLIPDVSTSQRLPFDDHASPDAADDDNMRLEGSSAVPSLNSIQEFAVTQDPGWSNLSSKEVVKTLEVFTARKHAQENLTFSGISTTILATVSLLHKSSPDSQLLAILPKVLQRSQKFSSSLTDLLTAAFLASQVLLCPAAPSNDQQKARIYTAASWKTIALSAIGLLTRAFQETTQLCTTFAAGEDPKSSQSLAQWQISKAVSKVIVHYILLESGTGKDGKDKQHGAGVSDMTGLCLVLVSPHASTSSKQPLHSDVSGTLQHRPDYECLRHFCLVVKDTCAAVCQPGMSVLCANSAQSLLVDVITKAAHEDTAHAAQLVLLLATLIQRRMSHQYKEASNSNAGETVDDACAFLLGVLSTVVSKFGDSDLSAAALRSVHPAISSSRGPVRKLLLDMASLALEASHGSAATHLAMMCMEQGVHDKDATVRAKALSCLASKTSHILAVSNTMQDQNALYSGKSLAIHAATLASGRLLDATKTVRSRSMDLLHSLLTTTVAQTAAGQDTSTQQKDAKKAIASLALPGLYQLLDARQDSALYDAASIQVVESVLHTAVDALGPVHMLHQLLALYKGEAEHSQPGLSTSLQKKLVQRCQPSDPIVAYDLWSAHLADGDQLQVDQVKALVDSLDPGIRQRIAQESVRRVCMAMAEHTAFQEQQGNGTEGAPLPCGDAEPGHVFKTAETTEAAAKVLYCFMVPCSGKNKSRSGQHPDAAVASQYSNSAQEHDAVCEAAILLDACRMLLNAMQTGSAPRRLYGDATDTGEAGPTITNTAAALNMDLSLRQPILSCVQWCFKALNCMLDVHNTLDITTANDQQVVFASTELKPQILHEAGHQAAAATQAAPSLGQVILRALPALLRACMQQPCCSTVALDAALKLLCNCPGGASFAHKLLRQLELELQGHTDTHQDSDHISSDTARRRPYLVVLQQYVLLLGHMTRLYEKENTMMAAKALQTRLATKQQLQHKLPAVAPNHVPGQEAQHDVERRKDDATKQDQYNYMATEEAVQAAHTVAQEYVEKLVDSTVPGTRADILARLAQASQPGVPEIPTSIKAAALWAISQLMAQSHKLATKHVSLLKDALRQSMDMHLDQGAEVMTSTALEACQTLLLCNPNVFGDVLPVMEDLLHHLLTRQKDNDESGTASVKLLYKAVACYTKVLSAEKLKLQGSTWRLLATLVLFHNSHIRAVTQQLVRSLLSASHLNKTDSKAGSRSAARKVKIPGADPAGNTAVRSVSGQYKAGVMLLYSNCDEQYRRRLVEEVLVGEGLVSSTDLCHDGLVLAALQALSLADTTASSSAAACLIGHMTPSSKAVAALEAMLQGSGLGLNRVPVAEAQSIIQVLVGFAGRCKAAAFKAVPSATTAASGRQQRAVSNAKGDAQTSDCHKGGHGAAGIGAEVDKPAALTEAVLSMEVQQDSDRSGTARVLASLNALAGSLKGKPPASRTTAMTSRPSQPPASAQAKTRAPGLGVRPSRNIIISPSPLGRLQSQGLHRRQHTGPSTGASTGPRTDDRSAMLPRTAGPGRGAGQSARRRSRGKRKVLKKQDDSGDHGDSSCSGDDEM